MKATSANRKIRWGILSTAKIGLTKVIPAIQQSPFSLVTTISSRDLAKAQKAANDLSIEKSYGSYDELLNDPDIDAVYNPLPNDQHVQWTLKALEAGKHVLCEKPIGMNAEQATLLANSAANFPNLKVMEAFMYRFHPQWQEIARLIDSGAIGEVKTIHAFFSYYNTDPQNIRNKPEVGGGALMDIGCYCISFPRFIFRDEPEAVVGMVDLDPQMGTDRLTSGMLKFGSGKTATFTCSTQLMPYQRVNILGDRGQIVVEIPVNAPPAETTKIELITKEEQRVIEFGPVDQYTLQADAFCLAILENTPVPTPLSDAIGNMKVIDAIVKSATEQKWVVL